MSTVLDNTVLDNTVRQSERLALGATEVVPAYLHRCLNVTLELTGPIAPKDVQAGLDALQARHPALRTRFSPTEPIHAVVPPDTTPLSWLTDGEVDRPRALQLAEAFCDVPFEPGETPRLRAALVPIGVDVRLLVLAIDPLVCDAWSANILSDELVAWITDATPVTGVDAYPEVWRRRTDVLDRSAADGTVDDVRAHHRDAPNSWWTAEPGTERPSEDAAFSYRARGLPDAAAVSLLESLRVRRSSALHAAIVALARAQQAPGQRRTVVSTFVGRGQDDDFDVVGHLATDVGILVELEPAPVTEQLKKVRGEVFRSLDHQEVDWRQVVGEHTDSNGLSVSLLYLPPGLGGVASAPEEELPSTVGVTASRAALTICPTGADVDLFLVEQPPPDLHGEAPILRLGAMASSDRVSDDQLDAVFDSWFGAMAALAATSATWDGTPG